MIDAAEEEELLDSDFHTYMHTPSLNPNRETQIAMFETLNRYS